MHLLTAHGPGAGDGVGHGRGRHLLRWCLLLSLGLVVVLAGGLAVVVVRRGQPVLLPTPTGRYPVGRALLEWTDGSRTDPLSPDGRRPRELSAWLWYPSVPVPAGRAPAPYAPGAWDRLHVAGPAGLLEGRFDAVRVHAHDGPPAASGPFPVVVLEPGMGFAAPQYTVLAEDLASHGYLVAGVTPTYSANLTVLHGEPVLSTSAGNPAALGSHVGPAAQVAEHLVDLWAADARFVATRVGRLDRSGSFAGRVDRGHVFYVGHSFGGAAALQACSTDPDCAGAADLDGTQFGEVVRAGLHAPVLLLGSQGSCITGDCHPHGGADRADQQTARALLTAGTGPAWRASIVGTRHLAFTDDAVLFLAPPLRYLYPLGGIDGARGLAVADACIEAFLDHALRHTRGPLLADRSGDYPELRSSGAP